MHKNLSKKIEIRNKRQFTVEPKVLPISFLHKEQIGVVTQSGGSKSLTIIKKIPFKSCNMSWSQCRLNKIILIEDTKFI